jgi:hypothetical protein
MNRRISVLIQLIKQKEISDAEMKLINEEQSDMAHYVDEQVILDNTQDCLWWYYINENFNNYLTRKQLLKHIDIIISNITRDFISTGGREVDIKEFIKHITTILISTSTSPMKVQEIDIIKDAEDKSIYIIVSINNSIIEEVGCLICNKKKYLLDINYKIIKPKNKSATKHCNDLLYS